MAGAGLSLKELEREIAALRHHGDGARRAEPDGGKVFLRVKAGQAH